MRVEDMVLFSVDDHLIEPPDMFVRHVPDRYKDQAPRVVHEDGTDTWVFGDVRARSVGLNAVASWPKTEWGFDPVGFAEMRPGCYDVHERVKDMNANGVLASMSFPSMARFAGQFFMEHHDRDLALIMLQAYNDWHIDEWCGAYPGRLLPLAIGPIWDPELLAAEVRRVAAKGCRAISFSEAPYYLDLPSFHSHHWDPFFKACVDEGVVIDIHIGSGSNMPTTSSDAPIDIIITLPTHLAINVASDLLWGPVLRQFPGLRVALSEGGVGWVPYFLERVDRSYLNQTWTGQDFGDKLPSDVFREHILTCFIVDDTALRVRDAVGVDNIAWECDYPHSDSTWPRSPETLMESFVRADVPDADIQKITHENALRWYGYDPFEAIPRDAASVGALRSLATGVDVETRGRAHFRQQYKPERWGVAQLANKG
jgi:predicted TIM-barrel fold metal-dependent hydrolase